MENGKIEDVQIGVGGLPFLGFVAAEVKLGNSDGTAAYYGFIEAIDALMFFESENSLYNIMLREDKTEESMSLLERSKSDEYIDYDAFYAELEEKSPSVRSRIRKYLICLVRGTWEEAELLKQETIGKSIGTLDLPTSDMEELYEERKITGMDVF